MIDYQHMHDPNAEMCFLGAFALTGKNPMPSVKKSDFYNGNFSRLYDAFCNGDIVPDTTNCVRYNIEPDLWMGVLESIASTAQAEYHGHKIRRLAIRREESEKRQREINRLSSIDIDDEELRSIVGSSFVGTRGRVKTADEILQEAAMQYALRNGTFDCEINYFREMMSGIAPGDHVVIAAASSVGKTSLGMQLCKMHKTLFVSGEMPALNIAKRWHSMEYNKSRGVLQSFSDCMIDGSVSHLIPKWGYVTDPVNIGELDKALADFSPCVALVDYLQLMDCNGHDRRTAVAEFSRSLKQLGKKHNCVIVTLCQVSRPTGLKPGQDPASVPVTLSRLKESGDIEESADIVFGAWLYNDRNTGIVQIQDIKNRNNGVHGAAYLQRIGPYFVDADVPAIDVQSGADDGWLC